MNLPRRMVVVLVVVGLLFVAILFLPLAGIGEGLEEENPEAEGDRAGLLDRVSAPVSISEIESLCLSGTSLVWTGPCQVSVAPAEGILGRLRFREFMLRRVQGIVQVQYVLTTDGEPPDPGDLETSADVGVPPRGLLIRLFCSIGTCRVDLDELASQ